MSARLVGHRLGLGIGAAAFLTTMVVLALVLRPGTSRPEVGAVSNTAHEVTVMTRNLYLGGDISRPVRAAQGRTGAAALTALAHATHDLRAIVDRTDFGVRGRLLAAEIATARPDLVGVQEVARWRRGPLQLDQLGVLNSTEVDLDFLSVLRDDLAGRGVAYDVVATAPGSDVEAPAFAGPIPTDGTDAVRGGARDVRLTIDDVLLRRHDSAVRVLATSTGSYDAREEVRLAGLPFALTRGWAAADLDLDGSPFRFVTTHLESMSADIALAQSRELLSGPAAAGNAPTVVVCDCNSDPADRRIHGGSTVPDSSAYAELTGAGLADLWSAVPAHGPGYTALAGELANDPEPPFDHRLDLVLARGSATSAVTAVAGRVVGDQIRNRDPATGLWPSDHAGVVLQVRIG